VASKMDSPWGSFQVARNWKPEATVVEQFRNGGSKEEGKGGKIEVKNREGEN
jgi:hypothetical protein